MIAWLYSRLAGVSSILLGSATGSCMVPVAVNNDVCRLVAGLFEYLCACTKTFKCAVCVTDV